VQHVVAWILKSMPELWEREADFMQLHALNSSAMVDDDDDDDDALSYDPEEAQKCLPVANGDANSIGDDPSAAGRSRRIVSVRRRPKCQKNKKNKGRRRSSASYHSLMHSALVERMASFATADHDNHDNNDDDDDDHDRHEARGDGKQRCDEKQGRRRSSAVLTIN